MTYVLLNAPPPQQNQAKTAEKSFDFCFKKK